MFITNPTLCVKVKTESPTAKVYEMCYLYITLPCINSTPKHIGCKTHVYEIHVYEIHMHEFHTLYILV